MCVSPGACECGCGGGPVLFGGGFGALWSVECGVWSVVRGVGSRRTSVGFVLCECGGYPMFGR
jgi:hypothetical protein